jgi:hypothetical protein
MTKEMDKLVAISGLAREMSNASGEQACLAGFWKNDPI